MKEHIEKLDLKTVFALIAFILGGFNIYSNDSAAIEKRVSLLELNDKHTTTIVVEQGNVIKDNTKVMNELKLVLKEITVKLNIKDK